MSDDDRTQSNFRRGGDLVANPFGGGDARVLPNGALVHVEAQRAVAEVQARMMIARANPRDAMRAMDAIIRDCTRPSMAAGALYQYARGGTSISGPSIRLAEAIAQRWGNIASGIKEIARGDGYSDCVAYAWDLETGFYDERQFQVRHWRDTKSGGYALKDERDIYELIANMGQRRKRAVLLTVIPGDVVESAVAQCEQTQHADADTSPEALKRIVDAFAAYGVTKAQLEARCQCRFDAVRPAQIIQLRKVFASLKDGMSDPSDWFEPIQTKGEEIAEADKKAAATKRTPAARATSPSRDAAGDAGSGDATKAAAPVTTARARPSIHSSTMESQPQRQGEDRGMPVPASPDLTARAEPKAPATSGQQKAAAPGGGEGASGAPASPEPDPIWASDEFGEPLEEPMTPIEFANWIANKAVNGADMAALQEHNADAIADACANPAIRVVITDALKPKSATTEEMEARTLPTAPAKPAFTPIVSLTPKGAFHGPNYQAEAYKQIEALMSAAEIEAWIATNKPTYGERAVSIGIENRLKARRNALGIADGIEAPTKPQDVPDDLSPEQMRDKLLQEVSQIGSQAGLQNWGRKGGAAATMMATLKQHAPEFFQAVVDAADDTAATIARMENEDNHHP